ncbi:beta-lactamase family protein [Burkholderia pseudomultivorans]|uniref:serine hydrolase domain-containing protein n=1 Tax=Burkholderia pseudomultivorans TaxID=1207504 RepID=UPI002876FB50|nr:serine hydrolase domain-containing protein [Burkholderia pseudomultivorans]MDS0862311.1 beta-lactamase family protein [Burkholderia pseudomultivorans]
MPIPRDSRDPRPRTAPASAGRRQFLGYAGASLLSAALPGCGGSDSIQPSTYGAAIATGRQVIQAAIDANPQNVATMSVALLKGNQVVWAEAFGNASIHPATAATLNTRYNIGSVSKVFAALAGVILQDRGLIDLDAPIVRYLPSFSMLSPQYTQITSRHLLSHSSGLPGQNFSNLFSYVPIAGYAATAQQVLANEHLNHPPGQFAVYCNDGFTIFEQVVEAVTGQRFTDFVQHNILAPLNMTHSGFLTSVPASGEFALAYSNGTQHGQEFANPYATGGLSSTPTDMLNLAQLFIGAGIFQGQRIASAAGIADMLTDQTSRCQIQSTRLGYAFAYGLGWDDVDDPVLRAAGVRCAYKSGGTQFFSSHLYVLPAAQMALMFTGSMGYEPGKIGPAILLQALRDDGSIAAAPAPVNSGAPPVATSPDVSAVSGVYGNESAPMQVRVNTDGSLALTKWSGTDWEPAGSDASPYRYRNDGWWWSDSDTSSYRFDMLPVTDDAGNAVTLRYLTKRILDVSSYVFRVTPFAQQLAALPTLDAAWQARVNSSWNVINESAQSVAADKLRVSLGTLDALAGYVVFGYSTDGGVHSSYQLLKPLADDRAGMAVRVPVMPGRDLLEISFTSEGGVETMAASGWQCRRA